MKTARVSTALFFAIGASAFAAALPTTLKSESFDHDPNWQAHNNHIIPDKYPTIVQDFGYSPTNNAGKSQGELGGLVTRAATPAFCADKLTPPLTLNDKLSASGTFAITKTTAGGGVFFGFFNAKQPEAGGRPINSLGLDFDTEPNGARLAVRMITSQNQSCGTFATPFIPGKFRPTPIRNDGTRYTWTLNYDPAAANDRGQFTFTIHAADQQKELERNKIPDDLPEAHKKEALKRFPHTTEFTVDLPEGYKQQNATFDHFGLLNMTKPGGHVVIHFDDLEYLDHKQNFTLGPNWDASGNRATYQAKDVAGSHNFGFSNTNHAGGQPGEIGGTFWRSERTWAYYADPVGPLTLDHRIEARGKVILVSGGPDSDMCFGFFTPGDDAPDKTGPFLGIHIGGPTRIGHYFLPALTLDEKRRAHVDKGPIIRPGVQYTFSLTYDPNANSITATLGTESVTLNLKPNQKPSAKDTLTHFGLFSTGPGGQIVKLYLDDLQYTSRAAN